MNNANNDTAAATSGVTWEIIDRVVEHELKTHKCVMRLKTSSRRLFAFVAVYTFIHRQLTNRRVVFGLRRQKLATGSGKNYQGFGETCKILQGSVGRIVQETRL